MARNIKGITIDIGGNTTKLQDALKGVNKTIYSTNSELKALNQALKLDPKNTELLSQKQEVLAKNIYATSQKLKELKEAQAQMGDYNKLTEEQKESYRTLSIEITKTESALKGMNQEMDKSTKGKVDFTSIKDGLSKVSEVASKTAKAVGVAMAAIGAAAIAAGKAIWDAANKTAEYGDEIDKNSQKVGLSTKAYQQWDYAMQISGTSMADCTTGMKTLTNKLDDFKNGSKGATETFNKLGISLDDVKDMSREDVFSLTVKQLQNVKDETEKAALANDLFGKSGQNLMPMFNMTNEETQKLIDETEKYGMVMSDDAVKASAAFEDSLTRLKKSLGGVKNRLVGSLLPGITQIMDGFSDMVSGVDGGSEKFQKGIKNLVDNVSKFIPEIVKAITDALPTIIEAAGTILQALVQGIVDNLPTIIPAAIQCIMTIANALIDYLPQILDAAIKIVVELAKGITQALPELIPKVVDIILTMVETLIDNIDLLVDVAVDIVVALAEGLIEAIPMLLEAIPDIIINLVDALTKPENLLKLVGAAVKLVLALAKGIIESIPALLKIAFGLPKQLADKVAERIKTTNWGELGQNMVKGILDGFANVKDYLTRKVNEVKDAITNKFKQIFDIHSPSRLMRDEIGKQITAGIGEGIEDGVPKAIKDVNAAMVDLNNGIQASVNPIINPTANSNPLYINIDKFYNKRDQDIQSIAEELEYYRKNSALAKGGQ